MKLYILNPITFYNNIHIGTWYLHMLHHIQQIFCLKNEQHYFRHFIYTTKHENMYLRNNKV